MTQFQTEYQKLQETRRHNLEMERLGAQENEIKKVSAEASMQSAKTKEHNAFSERFLNFTSGFKQASSGVTGIFDTAANVISKAVGAASLFI